LNELLKSLLAGTSTWPARDFAFLLLLLTNAWTIYRVAKNHLIKHVDDKLSALHDKIDVLTFKIARIEGYLGDKWKP
jgi:hypothetical protein